MIDPITAIGIATSAFNVVKNAVNTGREIEDVAGALGKWMGAVSDIKKAEEMNKKPPLFKKLFASGSVEEEAMQIFMAKKKAEDMREQLRDISRRWVALDAPAVRGDVRRIGARANRHGVRAERVQGRWLPSALRLGHGEQSRHLGRGGVRGGAEVGVAQ